MAIQFQMRRGTTAQNDAFIGAAGEMTLDTAKTEIRVHDGVTAGGHKMPTLVAVQYPSAENGWEWYRKYSDGWVEQGGVTSGAPASVMLPVEMADTNYSIMGCSRNAASGSGWFSADTITTTGFSCNLQYGTGQQAAGTSIQWEVRGIAA